MLRSVVRGERRRLRRALERSERHHRQLIEAMPGFVVVLDAGGAVTLVNRAFELATGLSRDELIGRAAGDWLGDGSGDRPLRLESGGERLVRWRLVSVDGGRETYAMGVDVTEERGAEARSRRDERLAAVGTLAAGLAHEVRNPLNSALLQLQLLERRIDQGRLEPEPLRSVASLVKDEIRRLDRLVEDFISFARPRPLMLEPTDVGALVSSVAELVRPDAAAKNVALELEPAPALAPVELEPERMRQVLLNLIRNAFEAMPEGGRLYLRVGAAARPGGARIEVEDTGSGIPGGAAVFEPFYSTKSAGTGLGLAIVHRIVTEHGGSIEVESAPGRTCFAIVLPAPPAALAEIA